MRNTERLRKLKTWIEQNLCEGRNMKAPAPSMDITQIIYKKPSCYLAWAPTRLDASGNLQEDPTSVTPGIIVMPSQAHAKYMEEKRFDRYNNVHRPSDMGGQFSASILFSVYEPGIRLPGFVTSAGQRGQGIDLSLIQEGTEEGLFTLMDWMDDCMSALLGEKIIPGTDMYLAESTMTYSLYTDQSYVVDRRPIYYGFINATFGCYAEERANETIHNLLS